MVTPKFSTFQHKLHEIIYEADTPMGKLFDVLLLIFILLSVLLVALESVPSIDQAFKDWFHWAEWIITILFSIEYVLRIVAVRNPFKYIFSFYGIIDLLSTLPKYIAIIFTGTQSLIALRALRLLRVFRILKLTRYIGESNSLMRALKASKAKILVFMFGVLILCVIFGTIMYLVESDASGFTSIPRSIYWCIVTLTTVGYGDIAPASNLGQFIAAIIMIMGYGIIAVPTGIVTAEFSTTRVTDSNTQVCPNCLTDNHKDQAKYCHQCGSVLNHE
ncbi:MAG: ion transporter [Bacteroidetes bacterium]|nr:ion transporter [Bacteroidota bacterium]MDA0937692.1 ion transporter [Bacteroidota bacterium]MDA1344342.1 ion transporter [Bacteroidota bacterium]